MQRACRSAAPCGPNQAAPWVTCVLVQDPDGIPQTGDEIVDCDYDNSDWVQLGYVDLSEYQGGCVKQVNRWGLF